MIDSKERKNQRNKSATVGKTSKSARKGGPRFKLEVGQVATLAVRALSAKNLGVHYLPGGARLFVQGAQLGDVVKVEITHTQVGPTRKDVLAKVVQKLKAGRQKAPFSVGDILTTTIQKIGPRGCGLASWKGQYGLVIPQSSSSAQLSAGMTLNVRVNCVKATYAFAQPCLNETRKDNLSAKEGRGIVPEFGAVGKEGSRFTLRLPRKAKRCGKRIAIQLRPSGQVLFVRLPKGVRLGEVVRLQLDRVYSSFALATVVRVAPISQAKKALRVRQTLRTMVQAGMHWGEKAVRCHARMRKYVWHQQTGVAKGRPWIKKGRHVLNLLRTRRCLTRVLHQVGQYAAKGRPFLFVGTKKSAAGLVARAAFLTNTSFYVNTRWLGGMLTNWQTILKSIAKIKPILTDKQQLVDRVLKRRRLIKQLLLQRVQTYKTRTEVVSRLVQQANVLLQRMRQPNHPRWQETQRGWNLGQKLLKVSQPLARTHRQLRQTQSALVTRMRAQRQQAGQLIRTYAQLAGQLTQQAESFRQFRAILRMSQTLNRFTALFTESTEIGENIRMLPTPPKTLVQRAMQWARITSANAGSRETVALAPEGGGNDAVRIFSPLVRTLRDLGPYAQTSLTTVQQDLQSLERQLKLVQKDLGEVRVNLQQTKAEMQSVQHALRQVDQALVSVYARWQPWKVAYRGWTAEKRFWKFVPKLKQVATSQLQMLDAVQAVMHKLVDPKLKQRVAMYDVYAEKLKNNSKKVAAARKKQWQRLETYLGGVARLTKLKEGQLRQMVAIIVGQSEEMNAVRECRTLGMATVQLVDTDGNPTLADHLVPMNDDSKPAIKYVLQRLVQRIRLAQKLRAAKPQTRVSRMTQKRRRVAKGANANARGGAAPGMRGRNRSVELIQARLPVSVGYFH